MNIKQTILNQAEQFKVQADEFEAKAKELREKAEKNSANAALVPDDLEVPTSSRASGGARAARGTAEAMVRSLLDNETVPMTAPEIFRKLQGNGYAISLPTVYNVTKKLIEEGNSLVATKS